MTGVQTCALPIWAYVVKCKNGGYAANFGGAIDLREAKLFPLKAFAKANCEGKEKVIAVDIKIVKKK